MRHVQQNFGTPVFQSTRSTPSLFAELFAANCLHCCQVLPLPIWSRRWGRPMATSQWLQCFQNYSLINLIFAGRWHPGLRVADITSFGKCFHEFFLALCGLTSDSQAPTLPQADAHPVPLSLEIVEEDVTLPAPEYRVVLVNLPKAQAHRSRELKGIGCMARCLVITQQDA